MKPVQEFHDVPHKPNCDCLTCQVFERVRIDAYLQGYKDGLHKAHEIYETEIKAQREELKKKI